MTNAELVAVAVGKWLTPIVKTIGGGIKIPVAFQRWLADIKAQNDEVPWQRFI